MADNLEPAYRVSVVIPAYNAGSCIGRAIDSVLAQTFAVGEIIVVNDGSTDNTEEVVQRYGEKVIYIRQNNAGVSVARNRAIASATGNWIAFLDADDEWLPEKNQRQIELLRRNTGLLWCSGNYYRTYGAKSAPSFNSKAIAQALKGKEYFENYFWGALKAKCRADTPSIMVNKKLLDELGTFEPGRKGAEDLDIWWKIAHRYPKIGYVAEPLAIVHLDVHEPLRNKSRLEAKRGVNARSLIERHLKLSKEMGDMDIFHPFAINYMKKTLLVTLCHGLKEDARLTVGQFRELFPSYWRYGTYLLTVCPKLTSFTAKTLIYLAHISGIDKEVTRRGKYPKSISS